MKFEYYKEGSEYHYEFRFINDWDGAHVEIRTIFVAAQDSWCRTARLIRDGAVVWHAENDLD